MLRKVIVGHDLHDGGDDALALGRAVTEATGASLVLAGVFPIGHLPRGFEAEWREQEAQVAARLQVIADSVGAAGEGFPSSSPARGLHDLAEELGADLVVVGSSRHSRLGEILAGSVALGLLHGAPCAVAIAPKGYRERGRGPTEVVVGFDGGDESRAAMRDGAELARASGARLRLVAVAAPLPESVAGGRPQLRDAVEEELRDQLEEARAALPGDVSADATVVHGDPAQRLAEAGASDDRLLVVGSRGFGPLRRVVLGSVSSALVRAAPCPVLVEPRRAQAG